ncbi:MAG: glycosyltransferase family 4 protein [Pseudomonadota bacterium]|nr:glycosyltransferase family 4 protein [Pseudomonadota bacterium]
MKVAVIHEWLLVEAGAEKVLGEILDLFPEADLFCLLDYLPTQNRGFIGHRVTKTSFIQRLPFAQNRYRFYLPLMPLAIEQFDLSAYDLVISCNYAVAKGVITGPDQLHISYIHSPMRYAWDLQFQYLRQAKLEYGIKSWIARWLLHKMRLWDCRTAHGVDHYIANSEFIARRIKKVYGRSATVIYPPVATDYFTPGAKVKEDFYLTVSRLVPYKYIDVLVKAFASTPERKLIIIGSGPEEKRLKSLAGDNVTLLGFLETEQVRDYMRRARAFLFVAEEDFGIVPLEAQACGTPVIAYNRGGAKETIVSLDNKTGQPATGLFFSSRQPASLKAAIDSFEKLEENFTASACRANALRFSTAIFRRKFQSFVEDKVTIQRTIEIETTTGR